MNADYYAEDIEAAREAIEEAGEDVVWIKAAARDPDAKPWRDQRDGQPERFPVSIAFFSPVDVSRGSGQTFSFTNETDIADYSEVGLMAGDVPFQPDGRDKIERNGALKEIVAIDRIAPNGTPILYYVGIK